MPGRNRFIARWSLVGAALLTLVNLGCGPAPAVEQSLAGKAGTQNVNAPPYDSGVMAPFNYGHDQSFTIEGPPPAANDVSLGIIVSADLSQASEYFTLYLNDTSLGRIFDAQDSGLDCASPAQERVVVVPADMFNSALVADGKITIRFAASHDMDARSCLNSFVRVVVSYCGANFCPHANPVEGPPRLVSAVSTGNTSVRVTFNEPVYAGATDPFNFAILDADINSAAIEGLQVVSAALNNDLTQLTLTTSSQSDGIYELVVTGIQDLAGNVIAPPDLLLTPTRTQFAGTPANDDGPDTDGDGVSDGSEQRGWDVTITLVGGALEVYHVTSDPTVPDTDGDGVSDVDENRNRSDPRKKDTDSDTLSDSVEWNITFTSLTDQDSDKDALDDGLEVSVYKTSPTLADTDGDGLDDNREIFELFRDPRVADLPRPRIFVSNLKMNLDTRYTYTDEQGETVSQSVSSSSNLSMSQSSSYNHSTSNSNSKSNGKNIEGSLKGSLKKRTGLEPYVEFGVEGGVSYAAHDEHQSQTTTETAEATQRAYERSLSFGRELTQTSSVTRSVTREVVGASLEAEVIVEDAGGLAFSISNLEITVQQPSLVALGNYDPVAALLPSSLLTTGNSPTYNLGPLQPSIGPVLFKNREIFPSEVESLMANPRGLVFRIANYDLTDEFGRNFAFSSQEARDRSAGITIDRGDAAPVRALVAINGQQDTERFAGGGFVGGFDQRGGAVGLKMDYILQDILHLEKNRSEPDGIVAGPDGIAGSYASGDDVQLTPPGTRGLLETDVVIGAGANGVLDSQPVGDDQSYVTTGYETSRTCGPETPEQVIEPLSGGDGLANTTVAEGTDDVQLVALGAAVQPGQPIIGPGGNGVIDTLPSGDDVAIFPGQIGKPDGIAEPPANGNGTADTTAAGDDVQLVAVGGALQPGQRCIGPGPNGVIDTQPEGDDVLVSAACADHPATGREILVRFEARRSGDLERFWVIFTTRLDRNGGDFGQLEVYPGDNITLSFIQDQDRDGITAKLENAFQSSDALRDTDGDQLDDFVELNIGWDVAIVGLDIDRVFPSPSSPNSDGDNLTDWEEQDLSRLIRDPDPNRPDAVALTANEFRAIFGAAPGDGNYRVFSSNPRLADSDGDGVSDHAELNGYSVGAAVRAGTNGICNTTAVGDDVQKILRNSSVASSGNANGGIVVLGGPNGRIDSSKGGDDYVDLGRLVKTSPLNPDSDADARLDGVERNQGSDPTNPNDGLEFIDTDRDGISDADEEAGWVVTVNHASLGTIQYQGYPNKFVSDTDHDGLPDLLEKLIGTDPTTADGDGDEIGDYDEFADFSRYIGLGLQHPGFVLNGKDSRAFGTNPNNWDTDGDTLSDSFELLTGWRVLAYGDQGPRQVFSDPLYADSDLDNLSDSQEHSRKTDPRETDTDGDSRPDGTEVSIGSNPLVPDIWVSVTYRQLDVSAEPAASEDDNEYHPGRNVFVWDFGYDIVTGNSGYVRKWDSTNDCWDDGGCNVCILDRGNLPKYINGNQEASTFTLVEGEAFALVGSFTALGYYCLGYDTITDQAVLLETFTVQDLLSGGFTRDIEIGGTKNRGLKVIVRVTVAVR